MLNQNVVILGEEPITEQNKVQFFTLMCCDYVVNEKTSKNLGSFYRRVIRIQQRQVMEGISAKSLLYI